MDLSDTLKKDCYIMRQRENTMKCLVTFGYESYITDQENLVKTLDVLQDLILVSSEYVNSKYIYTPQKEQKELKIELINENKIRELTVEEKENKEIRSIKSTLSYKEGLLKTEQEKNKALECEIELLKAQGNAKTE